VLEAHVTEGLGAILKETKRNYSMLLLPKQPQQSTFSTNITDSSSLHKECLSMNAVWNNL